MKEYKSLKSFLSKGTLVDATLSDQLVPKKLLETDAMIAVDRNRWFLGFLIMSLVALYSMWDAHQANQRLATNTKVVWLKMYPNGTWDMEFHDEDRATEFFNATIDSLIIQYVERRFSKIQHSIKSDYGSAVLFMSPELRYAFQDRDQFNAARVAAEVSECDSCDQVEIKVRGLPDHYDSDKTTFKDGKVGSLYRSNVFITETIKTKDGDIKDTPVKKIVSLHWRLKTKDEITKELNDHQGDIGILKINPIGLEILKNDLFTDSSE